MLDVKKVLDGGPKIVRKTLREYGGQMAEASLEIAKLIRATVTYTMITFEECAELLKISPRKARYLAAAALLLELEKLTEGQWLELGWTKVAVIASYAELADVPKWCRLAKKLTVDQLRHKISLSDVPLGEHIVSFRLNDKDRRKLYAKLQNLGARSRHQPGLMTKEQALMKLVNLHG